MGIEQCIEIRLGIAFFPAHASVAVEVDAHVLGVTIAFANMAQAGHRTCQPDRASMRGYRSMLCVCFRWPMAASIPLLRPRRVIPFEGPTIFSSGT